MPNRRRRFQAGVESGRRVDGTMRQHTTDHFIGAGLGVEIQLRGDMAEEVRMDP
jgi:hypothetical protein